MTTKTLRQYIDEEVRVLDFEPKTITIDAKHPRVYMQGQLHANETTSSLVLAELANFCSSLGSPVPLRIVPVANPLGWDTYLETGEGRISIPGGHNWNRIWGSPQEIPKTANTAEDILCRKLWELSSGYDIVIDVHTPEFGLPHLYLPSLDRGLNTFSDLPHVVYGFPEAPTFDESHIRASSHSGRDVIAVTLELPSHQVITANVIHAWANRLYEELESYRKKTPHSVVPDVAGTMRDLVPDVSGIAYALATPGEMAKAGEPIIRIMSRDGECVDIAADKDSVPLCYRRKTLIKAGSWAARVLILE